MSIASLISCERPRVSIIQPIFYIRALRPHSLLYGDQTVRTQTKITVIDKGGIGVFGSGHSPAQGVRYPSIFCKVTIFVLPLFKKDITLITPFVWNPTQPVRRIKLPIVEASRQDYIAGERLFVGRHVAEMSQDVLSAIIRVSYMSFYRRNDRLAVE